MTNAAITLQCPNCGNIFMTLQHGSGSSETCPHCAVASPRQKFLPAQLPQTPRSRISLPAKRTLEVPQPAPPVVVQHSVAPSPLQNTTFFPPVASEASAAPPPIAYVPPAPVTEPGPVAPPYPVLGSAAGIPLSPTQDPSGFPPFDPASYFPKPPESHVEIVDPVHDQSTPASAGAPVADALPFALHQHAPVQENGASPPAFPAAAELAPAPVSVGKGVLSSLRQWPTGPATTPPPLSGEPSADFSFNLPNATPSAAASILSTAPPPPTWPGFGLAESGTSAVTSSDNPLPNYYTNPMSSAAPRPTAPVQHPGKAAVGMKGRKRRVFGVVLLLALIGGIAWLALRQEWEQQADSDNKEAQPAPATNVALEPSAVEKTTDAEPTAAVGDTEKVIPVDPAPSTETPAAPVESAPPSVEKEGSAPAGAPMEERVAPPTPPASPEEEVKRAVPAGASNPIGEPGSEVRSIQDLTNRLFAGPSLQDRLNTIADPDKHRKSVEAFFVPSRGNITVMSFNPLSVDVLDLPTGQKRALYNVITSASPHGGIALPVTVGDKVLLDWPLMAQMHDQTFDAFFSGAPAKPPLSKWFKLFALRVHDFKLSPALREEYMTLEVQGSLSKLGKVAAYVAKDSAVGRYLESRMEWNKIYMGDYLLSRTPLDGKESIVVLDVLGAGTVRP